MRLDFEEARMLGVIALRESINAVVPGKLRNTPWSWCYYDRACERRWEAPSLLRLLWRRWRWRGGMR